MNQPLFIGMTFWPLCCHGVGDGKVFLLDGSNLNFVMNTEYDVATDSTTEWGQATEPGMSSVRGPGLGGFDGYYILATGNIDAVGYTKTTKNYTVAADTWSSKTDAPEPPRQVAASGVVGASMYVVGGSIPLSYRNPFLSYADQTKEFDEYNPTADAWSSKAELALPELSAQNTHSPVCFQNGTGSEASKLTYSRNWGYGQTSHLIWDQASDAWSSGTWMTHEVIGKNHSSHGGTGYCATGSSSISNVFTSYDFSSDSWTDKADIPSPGRRNQLTGARHDTTHICFGGQPADSYDPLRDVDHYDTTTDSWTSMTDLGTGRHSSGAVTLTG